jgi:prepilin-type N-terminal cleavage/methylation domain-containing protein
MNIKNKKGFTLIELLVVVLIIGILAAIALPQYEQAVEKSRAVEALSIMKTIKQAQETYYLINDKYTQDFDKLDISIPGDLVDPRQLDTKYFRYTLVKGSSGIYLDVYRINNSSYPYFFTSMFDKSRYGAYLKGGGFYCSAAKDSVKANKLCKSLGYYLGLEQGRMERYKI